MRGDYTVRQLFKRNLVPSGSEAMYCERRLYSETRVTVGLQRSHPKIA